MPLTRARLKQLRALKSGKGRRQQGAFLIEGDKLLRDAIAAGVELREVLALPARSADVEEIVGDRPLTLLSTADAERLSDTRTPQGCFAVVADNVPAADAALKRLPSGDACTVVLLDAVQDPGNVGALIRVAAAFDAALLICGPASADPTHPKVVRAATGAWFQIALARSADAATTLDTLQTDGFALLGSDAGAPPLDELGSVPPRRVVVFGSEGSGFSPSVAERLGTRIGVPIATSVESLNVAVAAGILLAGLQHRSG